MRLWTYSLETSRVAPKEVTTFATHAVVAFHSRSKVRAFLGPATGECGQWRGADERSEERQVDETVEMQFCFHNCIIACADAAGIGRAAVRK